jgi:hypothetical protein
MSDEHKAKILCQLNLQAQELGVQYIGNDPEELAKLIGMVAASRAGRPPCFLRSYSPMARLCKQCDHFMECGERTIMPKMRLAPEELIECDMCDGDLIMVLYNDHGTVVDMGCSTPGCLNILSMQKARQ